MSDILSKNYLLYLRDMSKKVLYGSGSAGNYSQVLYRTSRVKNDKRFQRISNLKLKDIDKIDGYKVSINQEKIGNGIFCTFGILCGTFPNKKNSNFAPKIIAAPIIYSQLFFEEDGNYDLTDWIINYDIITSLIYKDSEEEDYSYFPTDINEDNNDINEFIEKLENNINTVNEKNLSLINNYSLQFFNQVKILTNLDSENINLPIDCIKAAIKIKEEKVCKLFFCPGDWIFYAPVPPGLSTFRALNDLSEEMK
tara:strand:- start:3880 stop:4638 length:759 start_codon:yes stop_codon:yes gene_type:complete